MLAWSQEQLAAASQVAKKTIADFERDVTKPHPRTVGALRAAFEAAGVTFIPENGDGAGVRLRAKAG